MKKFYYKILLLSLVTLLMGCSSDYVNVVPKSSVALASVDLTALNTKGGTSDLGALKALLPIDDIKECGLDFSEKVYAFEDNDGSLGLVAKVSDSDDLDKCIEDMKQKGFCSDITENRGCKFTVVHSLFMLGYTDYALLLMGPSIGAAQTELQRKMAKRLKADKDGGARETELFERLENQEAALAFVGQAQALPDKLSSLLTLGAPEGTSPSDIYVALTFDTALDGALCISGESFSFKGDVDKALKTAASKYRPISGKYLKAIPADALLTMICGVNGEDYIKQLRTNQAIRSVLVGLNTAIDMDKMLKSVNGDMLMTVHSIDGDKMDFQMVADSKAHSWLDDVEYWKQSCPVGTKITDWNMMPNAFHLTSQDWNVYFGLTPSAQLFFGSNEHLAISAGKSAENTLPESIMKIIEGNRLCLLVNIEVMASDIDSTGMAKSILQSVLGENKTIVFSIK